MKKMIQTLLVTLSVTALFTPTPAIADVYDDTCIAGEDAKACLERVFGTLLTATSEAEAQVVQLRQAQASAISTGDGAEVARLQRLLAAKDAEIVELKRERDELRRQVTSLQGQVTELSGRFDDLNARLTSFLAEEAARPVAAAAPEPAPERTIPVSAGETRLAVYERPLLDESVFGEMAYVRHIPEIPSPIAHPDVPWRDAGNCLRIMNITSWYMFIRVDGARFYLDESGHTTLDEVLLAPGESVGHCQGERAITSRTAARISTAPSAQRHWDGRRWVSVERSSWTLRYPGRYSQADRIDRDGGPDFRE